MCDSFSSLIKTPVVEPYSFFSFDNISYIQRISFMSTYKLYYFNGRGRAEVCRLIFAAAGQKYEDIRYEHDAWPTHKTEMPLGQMPALEFDGVKIPQSLSIARFLAKQFQLAGKDNFEQAKVDAVVDTIIDASMKLMPLSMEQDEVKKQELIKKCMGEEMPKHLQNIEVLGKLYGNGGSFLVGNQLTWADLLFHYFGEILLGMDENCLDNHPWLKQNRAEVEKQPKIAEYLKNRPKTAF
jgi:glutathione S-transferase